MAIENNWAEVTSTGVPQPVVGAGPARIKDIATLDARLTEEIRRQTEYLILAIARACPTPEAAADVAGCRTSYLADCEDADKVRRP